MRVAFKSNASLRSHLLIYLPQNTTAYAEGGFSNYCWFPAALAMVADSPIAPCKTSIASRQSERFAGLFPRPVAAAEGQSIVTGCYVAHSVE